MTFSGAENVLNRNHRLDAVMVTASGVTKRVTRTVQAVVP